MTAAGVVFLVACGVGVGYLLRRWHRPVGYRSPAVLEHGEWQFQVSRCAPTYSAATLRGRFPLSPEHLSALRTLISESLPVKEPL